MVVQCVMLDRGAGTKAFNCLRYYHGYYSSLTTLDFVALKYLNIHNPSHPTILSFYSKEGSSMITNKQTETRRKVNFG